MLPSGAAVGRSGSAYWRGIVMRVAAFIALASVRAPASPYADLSVDGNTLYTLGDCELTITPLPGSAPDAKTRVIPLRRWFSESEPHGLQVTKDGSVLLLEWHALYRLDLKSGRPVPIATAPKNVGLTDLAYDPASGNALMTGATNEEMDNGHRFFWIWPGKGNRLRRVLTRSVDAVDCPAFNAKGELFFASRGDLWSGTVGGDGNKDEAHWVVTARREAPVAYLYTYEGTPMSRGIIKIAPLKDQVFLEYHRLNGSDTGEIWRLPWPPAKGARGGREFDGVIGALQTLEFVGDQPWTGAFASNPASDAILYSAAGAVWRKRGEEPAEKLEVKLP